MPEPITQGQLFSLNKTLNEFASCRDQRLYMARIIFGKPELSSTKELTQGHWRGFRDKAFPNWGSNDWELGDWARSRLAELATEWTEEVQGQMRLL